MEGVQIMNPRLTLALGAAALAAVLASPAQAGHVDFNIGIGLAVPPVVVTALPVVVAPVVYAYQYYPSQQVYYDPGRGLYFWYERGSWLWGPTLPSYIALGPRHLALRLAGPWPYHYHQDVYRRYPPHWARGHWHR